MKTNPSLPTADRLLEAAESLFAQKGFYGASIRDIAQCLSIAKSSLLHHYPSKEKLYGEVLNKIALEMTEEVRRIRQSVNDEREQLRQFIRLLWENSQNKPNRENIIIREMLDNPKRADKVKKWFFVDYLNELTGIIRSGQARGIFKPVVPEVFIFQLLGAHRYVVISMPTVKQFFPAETYKKVVSEHTRELEAFVGERLFVK
ncbi:MAG: TetR/AcrR family transcriptional regulator [Desulfobacterales bacterium]|jgi:AcrR family transcriptional regulator|nr:TetR/AcrR family transcriptional regulator [Desulfobacterales bacterium]